MAKGDRHNLERLLRRAWEWQTASHARGVSNDAMPNSQQKPKVTIGQLIWSWPVVGGLLSVGVTFMTSGHPILADICYFLGSALFIAKFLTWEENKQQPPNKRRIWSRIGVASAVLVFLLAVGGNHILNSKTKTRSRTVAELSTISNRRDWNLLAKRLDSIEGDPALHDVSLYFRGLLYSNSKPAPDPERYLSQVPQDSDFFVPAQDVRLRNYAVAPSEELGKAIMESLDRASLRNPIYYSLRLELSPNLTFNQVSALYDEFATRYQNLFDFTHMRSNVTVYRGVYVSINLEEVAQTPGCVLLFLFRQLNAAHSECLMDRKQEILGRYDMLRRNVGNAGLSGSLRLLQLDTTIEQRIEELRRQSNGKCTKRLR